jgi:deoxyribodipyrimidine photo-lyase
LGAVEPERVHLLNSKAWRTGYYYWMQACQKAFWNPALELAVELANDRGLPVLVAFGLRPSYPGANLRHYLWMLEGLEETARALEERSIGFVLRLGHSPDVALELAKDAGAVVTDRGYLSHQRLWRQCSKERAPCLVVEVEGDAVIPLELAYPQEAKRADLLRPNIVPLLPLFLRPLEEKAPKGEG